MKTLFLVVALVSGCAAQTTTKVDKADLPLCPIQCPDTCDLKNGGLCPGERPPNEKAPLTQYTFMCAECRPLPPAGIQNPAPGSVRTFVEVCAASTGAANRLMVACGYETCKCTMQDTMPSCSADTECSKLQ